MSILFSHILAEQFTIGASADTVLLTDRIPRGLLVLDFHITFGGNDPGTMKIMPIWRPARSTGAIDLSSDIRLVQIEGNSTDFFLGSDNPRVPVNTFVTPTSGYLACRLNNTDAANSVTGTFFFRVHPMKGNLIQTINGPR
jgi:hypothetical protein